MKILLMTMPQEGQVHDYTTDPFFRTSAVRYMPLGILSVAAGIGQEHGVRILDASSRDLSITDTIREIESYQPDVLGLSVVTQRAYAMAEILRRTNVPVKAVGGPHTTHYSEEILNLGADAVFLRDGDRNFGLWLEGGCSPGIFMDYIGDLDSLPYPARDLLNLRDYSITQEDAGETIMGKSGIRLPISSSRGCPFSCVFCDVQGKEFRWKSPSYLVDEMESVQSPEVDSIHILDDNFNVIGRRVLDICKEITTRKLDIKWSARGRVKLNDQTAEALVDAGCRRLHVGVESLNPEVLKFMNKGLTLDSIVMFFNLCTEYGIETVAYFIVGSPMETRIYREELPSMIRILGVTYPYFNVLYPLSNTQYYRSLIEDGTFGKDYWKEFAANPTPNYELPLPRSPELQDELQGTVQEYIKEFY